MPKAEKDLPYWEEKFPSLDPVLVAARLEALREALGLNKAEMARRIGVAPSVYVNWLPGTKVDGSPKLPTRLTLHTAVAIAEACGVTVDYIGRGDLSGLPARLHDDIASRLRVGGRKNVPKKRKS
jgi:transcriptional regulator with XRE-family HTH domain